MKKVLKSMLSYEHFVDLNVKIIYQEEKIIKQEKQFVKMDEKIIQLKELNF